MLRAAFAIAVTLWLSTSAAMAAPKPLSMFTTVTPLAQLESMLNSGVNPLSDAPYPTLVGTAIIG